MSAINPAAQPVPAAAKARQSRKAKSKRRTTYGKTKAARPFYRAARDGWFIKSPDLLPVYGKTTLLLAKGKDNETAALEKYAEVMRKVEGAAVALEAPTDCQRIDVLADQYLDWYDRQNHNGKRASNVRRYLKDFCRYCGANSPAEFDKANKEKDAFDKWLDSHKGWKSDSARRTVVKMIKAFFRWLTEKRNLSKSPLAGYSPPQEVVRVTIFDDQQEAALLANCSAACAQLIGACIATGGRPLSEVGSVTAAQVVTDATGKPVAWDFGRAHKTGHLGKDRLIYLSPAMSELTSKLMTANPTGPLFRNSEGKPLTAGLLTKWFKELRIKANKVLPANKQLDKSYVLYSCRHTFIVRQLIKTGGDVALVAEMAGNSMAIIDKHYKKWGKQRSRILEQLAS